MAGFRDLKPHPIESNMLAKLNTLSLLGIEALPVEVEVDVSSAPLPKTVLVGLPEQAVKESIHRVERAIVNSGFMRLNDRVVINLAPAELPNWTAPFCAGVQALAAFECLTCKGA